jgi:hypothetical protein
VAVSIDYNDPLFAFKKGPPRVQVTRAEDAREAALIAATRIEVFRLDPRCVICLGQGSPDDELNEFPPRSQTRGQRPEARFNRRVCMRVCRDCHQRITAHAIKLAYVDPAQGMDGGLAFELVSTMDRQIWLYVRGGGGHARLSGTIDRGILTRKETPVAKAYTKPVTPTTRKPVEASKPKPPRKGR